MISRNGTCSVKNKRSASAVYFQIEWPASGAIIADHTLAVGGISTTEVVIIFASVAYIANISYHLMNTKSISRADRTPKPKVKPMEGTKKRKQESLDGFVQVKKPRIEDAEEAPFAILPPEVRAHIMSFLTVRSFVETRRVHGGTITKRTYPVAWQHTCHAFYDRFLTIIIHKKL